MIGMDAHLLDVRRTIDGIDQQITDRPILRIHSNERATRLTIRLKVFD
jgi:hypothetical protein